MSGFERRFPGWVSSPADVGSVTFGCVARLTKFFPDVDANPLIIAKVASRCYNAL